ncbi:MAG: dihydroorotase [bacterium]
MSNKVTDEDIDILLLKNGHILDPNANIDRVADILIEKDTIKEIGKNISKHGKTIDCKDKTIVPGLIDMHTHLREPGYEYKETIATGVAAARAGGFTAIACMPNTNPVIDSRSYIEFIKKRAKGLLVDVYPLGSVTKGMLGEELTEMGDMVAAGAVGFSDDGLPIKNSLILRSSLEYSKIFGTPIIEHCEDLNLSGDGVMNEGYYATLLGLSAIPSISEEVMVMRDILIAEFTHSPIHIAHVSTKGSVKIIEDAKKRGVKVTAETCPHYLLLTDKNLTSFDTNMKMKPPLRTEEDKKALIEGLTKGVIDVIASDHAPHHSDEKDIEFNKAAFGIIGLETTVGLILTHFVNKRIFSLPDFIEMMSVRPRKILNLPLITIDKNSPANITILDVNQEWKVDKNTFKSKSRNTPFEGWEMKGKSVGVINNGKYYLNI